MLKTTRLIIGISLCFTLLVAWFGWSALRAATPIAEENLRGAGLSIAAAIEQLAGADPSFRSLARYTTRDIAYFALIDRQGIIRFHTNAGLIGHPYAGTGPAPLTDGISDQRERLGTGEEVYLLKTRIHPDQREYLLVLALHTYRADKVIRRARTGVTVLSALACSLWGLTLLLLALLRRDEQHRREMRRREEMARLGEMGAVLAHEIRNPLAGIKGFAQLVELTDSIEAARSHAAKIVAQSLRMEALVVDLLAFARTDDGKRETADLSGIVNECIHLLGSEARAQRVTVEFRSDGEVRASVVVGHIIQLLLNLLKNAVQAMPDGGAIRIRLSRCGGNAGIVIEDNGQGIPPEHMPHIFEPFWTSKSTGTGLGLALCRKFAEEHGGSLHIESRAGYGTTCAVTLPCGNRGIA